MGICLGEFMQPLANFLEVPVHENDMELPPAYLDYNVMNHQFVERNEQFL